MPCKLQEKDEALVNASTTTPNNNARPQHFIEWIRQYLCVRSHLAKTHLHVRVSVLRVRIRRALRVALLIFSGWCSEWAFVISWGRSIYDWWQMRALSAHPRLIVPPPDWISFLYGLSWRVAYYRPGPIDLGIFIENGFGLAVLVGVGFILIEVLKGRL